MGDTTALYDEDFVAWTRHQAEALRAAARDGANQRLDWENLAEEIEGLGKSDRRELASRLSVIIEHLVKLGHSPAKNPRSRWRQTIRRERAEIERLIEDSPSLGHEVPSLVRSETTRTAELAIRELDVRRELSPPLQQALKAKSHLDLVTYTPEQILGDWFPPEPEA